MSIASTPADSRESGSRASTRDRLLDVAAAHFAGNGFRHTSLAAVARELSITPSAIYFHFASKEQLFFAAYDRQAAMLADAVFTEDPEAVGDGYLKALLLSLLAAMPDYPLVMRVVRGDEPELLPRLTNGEVSRRLRTAIEVSLDYGQRAGRVRAGIDVERVSLGLESIMMALLLTAVQTGGVGMEVRGDAISDVIRLAIASEPPGR
ncbi:TetR/AcrR family transcriptional regulator [Gordonia sp. NPDC003425]